MKFEKLFLALLLTITKINCTDSCELGISLKPFQFNGGFKNVESKIIFKSNCMVRPVMFVLVTKFSAENEMSAASHPKKIRLNVYGRVYTIIFSKPITEETPQKFTNLKYTVAQIDPASISTVNTTLTNNIILRTIKKKFTYRQITRLYKAKNPVICNIVENKTTLLCRI